MDFLECLQYYTEGKRIVKRLVRGEQMSRSRGKVHTERKPRKLTLPSALLARHEFDRLEQYLSSEAMSRADLGSVEQESEVRGRELDR